ncbi:sensor histidine kinase [Nocardioides bruguierae]|uniref:sensor histidine kinase n=1 Tax=Nocardioides bruguierae TaxID=2945102 RepID=UPI00202225A5|nr:histidine kinase [Nocardioides bruguierae]MCL8026776.1 histidine kinase [Nocardioides bruguierae]
MSLLDPVRRRSGVRPPLPAVASPEAEARARQYWWVNAFALTSATVALAVAYLAGARFVTIAQDLLVMSLALLVLLGSAPWVQRHGGRAAGASVLASTLLFSLGAVWVTPFLAPLAVLALLVPLMVTMPLLDRRLLVVTTAVVLAGVAVVSGLGEWRRAASPVPSSVGPVVSLVVFTPMVVGVIAWVVLDTYRRLEAQSAELRASREQVVRAADAARRTLERDLHDGAQQRLVGLSLRLGGMRTLVEAGDCDAVLRSLDEAVEENIAAVRELRELARGIYPAVLTERGLVPALRAAALQVPVPCGVDGGDVPRYPENVEAAVYFCVLEALQNATKHARATEVRIEVWDEAGPAFRVRDDGVGFHVDEATRSGGGLAGMEARIVAIGGRWGVASAPGEGTSIGGVVPSEPR